MAVSRPLLLVQPYVTDLLVAFFSRQSAHSSLVFSHGSLCLLVLAKQRAGSGVRMAGLLSMKNILW